MKKTKPPNGKWRDVIEPAPEPIDGYDPYGLPDERWPETGELDGETLPLRGLREQLYSYDACRLSVDMKGIGGVRPFKDDYEDEPTCTDRLSRFPPRPSHRGGCRASRAQTSRESRGLNDDRSLPVVCGYGHRGSTCA